MISNRRFDQSSTIQHNSPAKSNTGRLHLFNRSSSAFFITSPKRDDMKTKDDDDNLGILSLVNNSPQKASGIRFFKSDTLHDKDDFEQICMQIRSMKLSIDSEESKHSENFNHVDPRGGGEVEDPTESEHSFILTLEDGDDTIYEDDINDQAGKATAIEFSKSCTAFPVGSGTAQQTEFVMSMEQIEALRNGIIMQQMGLSPAKKKKIKTVNTGKIPVIMDDSEITQFQQQHPKETFQQIVLEELGGDCNPLLYKVRSYRTVPTHFFTKGDVPSYTQELMSAVRLGDLPKIKMLHKKRGHNLQCCNKFNESIVHTVARRGQYDILEYLYDKVQVSVRVICDTGRTPLHDAAWTTSPNFKLIHLLLHDCPDLILLQDNKHCTPLDYIPKSSYKIWNEFLQNNRSLIIPKGLPTL